MCFTQAEVPVKQSPLSEPTIKTSLGPVRKELAFVVSSEPEMVEKKHEAEPELCQERQLFQERVLKVCSHIKQGDIVPAPEIWTC